MKLHAYCCFLPDLTRFTRFHCVGPNYQYHLPRADYTITTLRLDFNPATAGCRLQGSATTPSSTAKINQIFWRRERDSNPWGHNSLTRFPGVPLSQLGHLSLSLTKLSKEFLQYIFRCFFKNSKFKLYNMI